MYESVTSNIDSHIQSTIADLAWVINSAPIIQGEKQHCHWTDDVFWRQAFNEFATHLAPTNPRSHALQKHIDAQNNHRLGHYFETLLSYWFAHNSRYQLLAQNLPLHDGKRTVGEFDFIVRDQQKNKTQHWEVACKFYLGIGNTSNINNWHDAMLKDNLAKKYQQMQTRQSQLSEQPSSKSALDSLGIHIDEKICLMKGRLFYPLEYLKRSAPPILANSHLQAWWAKPTVLIQHFISRPIVWQILSKKQWLAKQIFDYKEPRYTTRELVDKLLSKPVEQATLVAGFLLNENSQHPIEIERGFLTPKDWANHLNIIDNTNSYL